MGRVIRVLLIIAVLASLSFSFNLRYKGYLEGNLLGSETTYDETPYLILSQRTSLFTRLDLIESLSIEARPVLIEYINPNKETGVFDEMTQLVGEGEGNLFNLQKSWTTEDELSRTSLILSRLNMELDLYPVVITVGRQRIDWGVGLIYRPLDVFNPSESISIRRGELGFSDALNAEFFLGGLSSAQVSFLPYRGMSGDEFDLTGKISTTVKSYDINLHFAYLRRDILAGVSFSGHLFDGEFYGSLLTRGITEPYRVNYSRALLGFTYRFGFDMMTTVEYFYNGTGKRDMSSYEWLSVYRGDFMGLGVDYLAGVVDYELTPLITVEVDALLNCDDWSRSVGLAGKFSTSDNTDLLMGLWTMSGDEETEFNYYPDFITYMQFRWYY
jgi:hypothetical protein